MVIDLPNCQIPVEVEADGSENEVDGFRNKIEILEKSERDQCSINRPQFTTIRNGNILVLNSEFKGLSCCYKGIQRTRGTDHATVLSEDCIKIPATENGLLIESEEAILVTCKDWFHTYTDYHAIVGGNRRANFKSESHVLNSNSKITKISESEIPSVLIIGLDAVARYHFERLMPNTRRVLKELGAIEMSGYAKVGLNTFPNNIPLLTGFSEEQLTEFCYARNKPLDSCPFIWHNLTQVMSTAFLEDAPGISGFNYYKFGFLSQPTSYYMRPLMLQAAEGSRYTFPCVGSRPTETFILDYIQQLHALKRPLFLFSWLTSLAHEGFSNLPQADLLFSRFFLKLNLQNTILIFMSDHGLRFGESRKSFNGWFNSKLPFFTIALSEKVKRVLGSDKVRNLNENSKKLTTPFDAYQTLTDILNSYSIKPRASHTIFFKGKQYNRTHGQSLFSPIASNRTCSDAGIPKDFCPCSNLDTIKLTNFLVHRSAQNALDIINSWLPGKCIRLEIDKITAGAKLNDEEFITGFTTKPGGFQFEAVASLLDGHITQRGDENGTFQEKISRISKVDGGQAICANDWFLELYCYCTFSARISAYASITGNFFKGILPF